MPYVERDRDTPVKVHKQVLIEILQGLKEISTKGPRAQSCGICYNLLLVTNFRRYNDVLVLEYYFEKWKSFSGDFDYPIEGSVREFNKGKSKWNSETVYGRLRWDLLEFLIQEIEKDLGQ
jgi:hypothetical protein